MLLPSVKVMHMYGDIFSPSWGHYSGQKLNKYVRINDTSVTSGRVGVKYPEKAISNT